MSQFEVEVNQKDLVKVLNLCVSIIEKRNVISILSYAKLEAKENKLIITVTNETLLLEQKIGAFVKKDGITMVEISVLSNIIRKLTNQKINILEQDFQISVKSGNSNFTLNTMDYKKFPHFLALENAYFFEIDQKAFVNLIKYTQFSMLNNETRYNLNGVCLHSIFVEDSRKLGAVATDGHRLAFIHADKNLKNLNDLNIILPSKLVTQIQNIFSNIPEDSIIKIGVDDSKIQILSEEITIVSKLIKAVFPQYQSLIPRHNNILMKINSNFFLEAINRVTSITNDKLRAVRLNITNNLLEISAYGDGRAKALEVIEKSQDHETFFEYLGEDITIGFNSRYLLDILDNFKNVLIKVYFRDSSSSVLIKSLAIMEADFVVMPIKV